MTPSNSREIQLMLKMIQSTTKFRVNNNIIPILTQISTREQTQCPKLSTLYQISIKILTNPI